MVINISNAYPSNFKSPFETSQDDALFFSTKCNCKDYFYWKCHCGNVILMTINLLAHLLFSAWASSSSWLHNASLFNTLDWVDIVIDEVSHLWWLGQLLNLIIFWGLVLFPRRFCFCLPLSPRFIYHCCKMIGFFLINPFFEHFFVCTLMHFSAILVVHNLIGGPSVIQDN